ncbi:MAG TPA: hypothetical protein DEP48_03135 [Persephonella sp.]|uniref:hypothetical protein n=1 Tax=Persephonella TaxID=182899 RepID=UPI00059FE637|nr:MULTISPECIES: hypothetical protein [Persephonella]HCB69333.1 hypothetical protein [Persephonella sp.]
MIRIIKLGNTIYENIEAKEIDGQGNEIWNVPNDVVQLKKALSDTLAWLAKQRVNSILDQYQYNGLADVQIYASQNDQEAQTLLDWYSTYDNLIWSYIDNDLAAFQTVDELLQIDMKNIEQQIYEQSIQTSPLP